MTDFVTLRYETRDRKAYITLDRPERLNAIDDTMPAEIRQAVERANDDDQVHVIILGGAGRSFCAGYDLKAFAEADAARWSQGPVWDPIRDYRGMKRNTDDFFTLWRSLKPTICKVQGHAVAGGSDIALSCDLVVMAEDARIGYMPTRVWGCPTTAMWVYRLGAEKAKRMLLTGDTIDGRKAAEWGLVLEAVPGDKLDARVEELADRMAGVPINQLAMQKLMVNQAYDNMGLQGTQILATVFDGITRHSPEGRCAALEGARLDPPIRVNAIHPGYIETEMVTSIATTLGSATFDKRIKKAVPLRKLGAPRDIADAVVFLASDHSRFMTGASLVVDGGMTAQ